MPTATHHDTPSLLTNFLREHPLLQQLFLACNLRPSYLLSRMTHYERITGEGGLMTEDFLPSLRTLETHPANLTLMIRRHVKSLQELERLSILYHCDFEIQALTDMVVTLEQGSPGFPSLSCLAVQLAGNWVAETETVEWIRRLGAYCPAVLSFTGHINKISPVSWSEHRLDLPPDRIFFFLCLVWAGEGFPTIQSSEVHRNTVDDVKYTGFWFKCRWLHPHCTRMPSTLEHCRPTAPKPVFKMHPESKQRWVPWFCHRQCTPLKERGVTDIIPGSSLLSITERDRYWSKENI